MEPGIAYLLNQGGLALAQLVASQEKVAEQAQQIGEMGQEIDRLRAYIDRLDPEKAPPVVGVES